MVHKTKLNTRVVLSNKKEQANIKHFSTGHGHNQHNNHEVKHHVEEKHIKHDNNHEVQHQNSSSHEVKHDEHHDEHHDDHHHDPAAHNYFLQKEFYPLHDQRAIVYGWDHVLPRQKEKPNFFIPDPEFDSHQWWNEEEDGPAGKNSRTRLGDDKPGIPNNYSTWVTVALVSSIPIILISYWIGPDKRNHKMFYPHAIKTDAELDSFVRAVLQAKKEGRIPDRHTWFDSTKLEPIDEYDDTLKASDKYDMILKKVD